MLDTFKARLKAKGKTLGVNLSQKRIDAIADRLHKKFPDITEDADHDAKIDDLHELQPLDEIAKQDDRLRTLEAKPAKPAETPKNDDKGDNSQSGKPDGAAAAADDTPAWAKVLMKEVESLKAEKTQTSIKSKLAEKLKDRVPESYYANWALPEKEEDLEDFATRVETTWKEFKQEQINAGLMTGNRVTPNGAGKAGSDALDSDIKQWAESKKKAEASKSAAKTQTT